ncbi:MAG: LamG domain-containing protein [Cytophagales bacterium]|nr:LamG domain-containing protein [Cytophagales bacterium]
MKRILVFLSLIPVLGISQPVTDGLVGYWPFNGNANDESGNGNDGTVNGAILIADRFDNPNSAYSFDGQSSIQISNSIGLQQWTVSAWINPSVPIPLDSPYYDLMTVLQGDSFEELLGIRNGSLVIFTTPIVEYNFENNNGWHHIVYSYNGTTLTGYVDFSTKDSIQITNPLNSNIIRLIGDRNQGVSHFFNGAIDDIIIYNRGLNEQEIQELYLDGLHPPADLCNNIYCDGENIGIGTYETKGYKLAVAGKIIAEEVKVALQTNWPDHVFDEKYKLNNLTYLENYIKTNKHLPNIPNAEFVAKEGYNLGEMDSKLLEKIEELTLYLIEQNKRTELLIKEVELLKEENQELRELIDH